VEVGMTIEVAQPLSRACSRVLPCGMHAERRCPYLVLTPEP
jgi:hypothetical protein